MKGIALLLALSTAAGTAMSRPTITLTQDAWLNLRTSLTFVTTLEMLRIQVEEAQQVCNQVSEAEVPLIAVGDRRTALEPRGNAWLASALRRAHKLLGKEKAEAEHAKNQLEQDSLLERFRRSNDKRLKPTPSACIEAADRLTNNVQELEDFFPLPPDRIK